MFLQGVLAGVIVCAILCALVVLIVTQVQNAFVGRVIEKTNKFSADAHADIEAFQEGMTKAVKAQTETVMKIVRDVRQDVEVIKTRVGGAFSVPPNGKFFTSGGEADKQ